jgi:adenylate kinase family enzyme
MPLRDRPLLAGGIDRDLYVARPGLEQTLLDGLAAGRNLLLIGAPGSGKSTTLRKLATDLDAHGKRTVLILSSPTSTTDELLELIDFEMSSIATGQHQSEVSWAKAPEAAVVKLIQAVRRLGSYGETAILIDGPIKAAIVYELFGRLREELWALPHQWVLACRTDQSAPARKPPADAFFSQIVEMPSFTRPQINEMLEKALSDDELSTVRGSLDARGETLLSESPRHVVSLARRALSGGLRSREEELKRTALLADLDRTSLLALAEIEALARPVSAGDEELLTRMGWSEAHARRVLAQMERAGLLNSLNDATGTGPGRPRKLYVLRHEA